MKAATWGRDSHGLFDYESTHVTKRVFKAKSPRVLVRTHNGEVKLLTDKEVAEELAADMSPLLKVGPAKEHTGALRTIEGSEHDYMVQNCAHSGLYDEANDKLWLILRSLRHNELKEALLFFRAFRITS